MSSPDPFVILTQGLSKSYGDIHALKDLNLQVPPHSIFGFLGPNGAGKTTTIKLLLGLARPTSGSGTVFGLDVTRDSLAIRKHVGYLAQDPRYYEHYTARETLRFTAGFFYSGPKDAVEKRIAETLELVGLSDKADRPIKGFSGGERQRLGIAQAQINYPDLLILDEPAASLDPMGRRDVLEVMERLRKHTTIFYSTHILSDVQRVSDTVAILNHGQLVAQAPIETLLAGSGKTVFSLAFQGDEAAARQRLQGEPWLGSIQTATKNGAVHWNVSVTDEQAASARLPRLILDDPQVTMVSFGRKTYDLEEVFMNIVEGEEKK
jgi:ABC-2 type transport system ATP-binding protein